MHARLYEVKNSFASENFYERIWEYNGHCFLQLRLGDLVKVYDTFPGVTVARTLANASIPTWVTHTVLARELYISMRVRKRFEQSKTLGHCILQAVFVCWHLQDDSYWQTARPLTPNPVERIHGHWAATTWVWLLRKPRRFCCWANQNW